MSITASGLYVANWIDILDGTQLAIDLSLDTHKLALAADAYTPNFDTDTAYSILGANEVSGTNWAAGGVLLSAAAAGATSTSLTLTISPAGTAKYDMNDVSVANTTISNAMAAFLYANALAGKNAILLIDFVTAVSTSAGTLGVQFAAAGVMTLDLTP